MARAAAAVMALIEAMQGTAGPAPLTGTGVGGAAYTGRACVVEGPEDALDRLQAGDVLIAPFTSPSFNSVLPLVGAIAVQEGGVMSHTAIVAREFAIPAVVGVAGLLTGVRDGELVEVDPLAGTVRRIEA
jgi:pyruvate,water dikinase